MLQLAASPNGFEPAPLSLRERLDALEALIGLLREELAEPAGTGLAPGVRRARVQGLAQDVEAEAKELRRQLEQGG